MVRPKVLIFLITDFARLDGGVLWAANLLQCMTRVQGIDFIIISSGVEEVRTANDEFTKKLGLRHIFVPLRKRLQPRSTHLIDQGERFWRILWEKYYFMYERDARKQAHVDAEVMRIINDARPDLIVVNGRNAALHVPSIFYLKTPRCLVTLDNEVSFHHLYRSQSGPIGERASQRVESWISRRGNWMANRRFRTYIHRLYGKCTGIVALTASDLPDHLPKDVVRAVIPPILGRSNQRWSYTGSRSLLFVGSMYVLKVMHAPNRLAIEWICKQLAPELGKRDSGVRINIIGATADEVPATWRCESINFLGRADRQEVVRQMTSVDLFIAPIANNHGAKLKLAECVSHGQPFVATHAATSGLPFLDSVPQIDLEQPCAAAQLVLDYINDPERLTKWAGAIVAQAEWARSGQDKAWSDFLWRSMATRHEEAEIARYRAAEG